MTDEISLEGKTQNLEGNEGKAGNGEKSKEPESISYVKYRELLDEKKKLAASFSEMKGALDKILSEKEEQERKSLEEKQEFKKLYEDEKKRYNKALSLLEQKEKQEIDDKKFNAFVEKVGGLKKPEYKKFFDPEKIPHTENGIDERSLEEYANQFKTSFPELVKETHKTPPPASAPNVGSTQVITNAKGVHPDELLAKYKQERLTQLGK